MTRETTYCDECGRPQDNTKNWIMALTWRRERSLLLHLGDVMQINLDSQNGGKHTHIDLCGQACLHKHIDKLLGLTGRTEE